MLEIINENRVAKNFISFMEHKGRHIISCGVFNRKWAKEPKNVVRLQAGATFFSDLKQSRPFLDIYQPLIVGNSCTRQCK
jgi:hypothetical protein